MKCLDPVQQLVSGVSARTSLLVLQSCCPSHQGSQHSCLKEALLVLLIPASVVLKNMSLAAWLPRAEIAVAGSVMALLSGTSQKETLSMLLI